MRLYYLVISVFMVVASRSYVLSSTRFRSGSGIKGTSFTFSLSSINGSPDSNATLSTSSSVMDVLTEHNPDYDFVDAQNPYRSPRLFQSARSYERFIGLLRDDATSDKEVDWFWEQIRMEALDTLSREEEAGPLLYQTILSQRSLIEAISTVIANDIQTTLIPATYFKNLFLELLTPEDIVKIRMDLACVPMRSPSVNGAMEAILFHNGFHALVCYRVGHRLWHLGRTGLAYYIQSTVSAHYSADIHPACLLGSGIYMRVGAGVVIGETAHVRNDVSILEAVTLGGTGKETGDRHPKVHDGVIIQAGASVLGNIVVGEGSVVSARSIVTKPVPPLAIVSGVPGRIEGYRSLSAQDFDDDLHAHLAAKYLKRWKIMAATNSS